jgi:hypothetical protein
MQLSQISDGVWRADVLIVNLERHADPVSSRRQAQAADNA